MYFLVCRECPARKESVVKVNNDSGTFTITGMSAGEATISLKAVMDLETVKTEVANYEFKILVE